MARSLPALLVLLIAAGGCAKPTSTFGGRVSFHGQPITTGVIFFLGPAPKYQMGMGTIRDDGTYVATDVPVGEVRVSFQAPKLPDKYRDPNQSGLAYTVAAGMTTLDIDIP
jgi:hypothetical protein